ncbi:unnamed protein product [Bursaphelenchus okinawaensis]|uniref:Peptidase A1 domain-containing protein n=1 Tax=Bursaphelenchus okinawaensis TaxID=465554 RepID=A0A811KU21_9BILA|nr:unnamed protein product [Bursaphelenchus okinawaensis]CAG9111831.1 unnamed protein product [Bursaphelenchus okinawaensis]
MMLFVTVLLGCFSFVHCKDAEYYAGSTPCVNTFFTEDKSNAYRLELSLQSQQFFIISNQCENCNVSTSDKPYDPTKYGAEKLNSGFSVKLADNTLKGNNYKGFIASSIFDKKEDEILPVVESADKEYYSTTHGLFGLDFEEVSDNVILKRIFDSQLVKKIIIRRGAYQQVLKDKEVKPNGIHGHILAGADAMEGCGTFSYHDAEQGQGLTLKGVVKIGNNTLESKNIKFDLDGPLRIPQDVFDKNYQSIVTESAVPQVTVTIGAKEYVTKPEYFVNYEDEYREVLKLSVSGGAEQDVIVLGREFLRDRCISIFLNSDEKGVQIGFADIVNLKSDVDYVESPAPTRTPTTEAPEGTTKAVGEVVVNVLAMIVMVVLFSIKYGFDSSNLAKLQLVYNNNVLYCQQYRGTVGSSLFPSESNSVINVVEKAETNFHLEHSGVFGLSFIGDYKKNDILRRTLTSYNVKKNLIIRRGPYPQVLKNKEVQSFYVHGRIVLTEDESSDQIHCTDFAYFLSSVIGLAWKNEIEIDSKSYEKFVKFSPERKTLVSQDIYDNHYSNIRHEEDIPDLKVQLRLKPNDNHVSKLFTVPKQNFVQYQRGELAVPVHPSVDGMDSLFLGQEFFRNQCVSLRVNSDDKLEIGFADTTPLPDDAKFDEIIETTTKSSNLVKDNFLFVAFCFILGVLFI